MTKLFLSPCPLSTPAMPAKAGIQVKHHWILIYIGMADGDVPLGLPVLLVSMLEATKGGRSIRGGEFDSQESNKKPAGVL